MRELCYFFDIGAYMRLKLRFFFLIATSLFFSCVAGKEQSDRVDPKCIAVATKQPEESKVYPIVIIGAGAAGTMAVRRAILNNDETLLFAGATQERRRSRSNWVRKVDNI